MKQCIKYIAVAIFVVGAAACSRPRTIPDNELAEIFKEFYLVNAYCSVNGGNNDSLDIYTPILDRAGYTKKDFTYTLGNFTKRKSARIGDIIEASIAMLERETDEYEYKVRGVNKIDSILSQRHRKDVLAIDSIEVRRMSDTGRLRITLPVVTGRYDITYNYIIDSLDKNAFIAGSYSIYDLEGRRTGINRIELKREMRRAQHTEIAIDKEGTLVYLIADYSRAEANPDIAVDSLTVLYYPTIESVRASFDSTILYLPKFIDNDSSQDSGALPVQRPQVAEMADSVGSR